MALSQSKIIVRQFTTGQQHQQCNRHRATRARRIGTPPSPTIVTKYTAHEGTIDSDPKDCCFSYRARAPATIVPSQSGAPGYSTDVLSCPMVVVALPRWCR
jgi:hypothetical protein